LYLLDNARSDLNIRTEKGFTCLHYAIINKKVSQSSTITTSQQQSKECGKMMKDTRQFAHVDILDSQTEAAKLMLQRGADPTIPCSHGSMVKLAEQFHAEELIPYLTVARKRLFIYQIL